MLKDSYIEGLILHWKQTGQQTKPIYIVKKPFRFPVLVNKIFKSNFKENENIYFDFVMNNHIFGRIAASH